MIRPALRRARVAALSGALLLAPLAAPGTVLDLALPGAHLRIGRATLDRSWLAALAQGVDAVTLDDVTLTVGATAIRAPHIEVRGTVLTRAELAGILDGASAESASARLARLTAREIAIPELRVEQSFGARKQLTRYRDVTLRDVAAGRIARMGAAGAELKLDGGPGDATGHYGRVAASDLDLAQVARLASERAEGPMARVYGDFSVEDVAFTEARGTEVRIAKMAGGGFSARPTKDSWGGLVAILGQARPDGGTPEERQRLLGAAADILDAVEVGPFEIAGMTVKEAGPAAAGRAQVDLSVARIAYGGGGRPAELRVEGVQVGVPEGRMRLASMVSTGFSLAPTLEGLRALSAKPPGDVEPADMRRLTPTPGTLTLTDLAFEPAGDAPAGLRVGLRGAVLSGERPINGMPTESRVALDGFTLSVPPDATQDGLRDLAALGYRDLDLSWLMDVAWNEPTGELALREISLSGRDMGVARLRATVAGVGREVFDTDSAVVTAAMMGAAAKRLDVTIENAGLFERVVAQQAREQGRTPEEIRRDYAMLAGAGIPAMLGNGPAAKGIGQAVARFVTKPGRLTIAATAKDPAGLGVSDFAAAGAPSAVLDLLDVTATAE